MKLTLFNNKSIKNMSWIIGSKIAQSILSIFISMLTARYLGPSNFGLINYVSSIVTFTVPIMQLGFNNIIVHELTNNENNEGKILGTILTLSFFSAILCMLFSIAFCSIANFNEPLTIAVCALYSTLLLFQSIDMIQYWFQAKLMSKWTSIASVISYILVSAYKIYILVNGKNIFYFALSNSLDYLFIGIFLFIFYKRSHGQKLSFSWKLGRELFKSSKHFIVPGLMVAIYGQTGKIFLKLFEGDNATGYFSAAINVANMTGFVFTAIIDSVRPIIFEYRKKLDIEKYENTLEMLYSVIIYTSIIQAILLTIFSREAIKILYGDDYMPSNMALIILSWYVTFSYLGSIRNIWLLGEGKQKVLWIINLAGAIVNVVLNISLIPLMGVTGAAISSLTTQIFTNFILGFILPQIRKNNVILMKSLNLNALFSIIKRKNE